MFKWNLYDLTCHLQKYIYNQCLPKNVYIVNENGYTFNILLTLQIYIKEWEEMCLFSS